MEENKEIKKKKMPLYLIAIAIVLAVLGVMDLKVNAAELYTANITFGLCQYDNGSFSGIYAGIGGTYTLTSNNPIYVYWYNPYEVPTNASGQEGQVFIITKGTLNGLSGVSTCTYNGETYSFYGSRTTFGGSSVSTRAFFFTAFGDGAEIRRLNELVQTQDTKSLVGWHLNDELNYQKPPIDYDSFQIDDSMAIPENLLYNIIRNKKHSENDTTGLGIIKDIEYYEYLTWNNTANYKIQVDSVPIVQIYKGALKQTFQKEFYGEWLLREILDENTNSYTKRTDSSYLFEDSPQDKEWEKEILDTYVDYGDNTYLRYGYRIRYVDVENAKASPWLYALPNENGEYVSYKEYSDGTTSDNEDITGTDNTYENIDDIEKAKEDVNKENEVKDEYDIIDGDADVGEITNWLNSVTGFIKSSPSVIGSVLSFLPQPILYGFYITIFLGVFATAVGIIKALI